MFDNVSTRSKLTVLDAGCGTGIMHSYLSNLGIKDCIGIDLSEYMLLKAKEKQFYTQLHQMYLAETLKFNPDSFDLLLCLDVTSYLSTDMPFFYEFGRITCPGGGRITCPGGKIILIYRDDVYEIRKWVEQHEKLCQEGTWAFEKGKKKFTLSSK